MPFAEDLRLGVPLNSAPAITIDLGVTAVYQAIVGDSLPLPLSAPLSRRVADFERLVNPGLVLQVAIGQSTVATKRVLANLFYRDVKLYKQVPVGTTLTTQVTPVAANRTSRQGRGKVLLDIRCQDESGQPIADFQRCALLPIRDDSRFIESGDIGVANSATSLSEFNVCVPSGWRIEELRHLPVPNPGFTVEEELRDTVSSSLELVRLTQNLALAHRDPSSGTDGRRLVYGGHTIGLAQAALTRALAGIVTILGWRACDHLAPVFEGDVLATNIEVIDIEPADRGGHLVGLRCIVRAVRQTSEIEVLDWQPVVWYVGQPVFTVPA